MPQTVAGIVALIGAILVALAVLGGKIGGYVVIPQLSCGERITAFAVGFLFVVLGIWLQGIPAGQPILATPPRLLPSPVARQASVTPPRQATWVTPSEPSETNTSRSETLPATPSTPQGGGDLLSFVVVDDGVNVRGGPSRQATQIATVSRGMVVSMQPNSSPTRDREDMIKWWPVEFSRGEAGAVKGWIAEFVGGTRFLKPRLFVGYEVQVSNPLCDRNTAGKGRIELHYGPSTSRILEWGTRLLIIDGPESMFWGDAQDREAAEKGAQWWQVELLEDSGDAVRGDTGWVVDFYGPYYQLLIAPEMYVRLSSSLEGAGLDRTCP